MHGRHYTSQLGTADSQLGQLVLGWWEPEQTDGHLTTQLAEATVFRTTLAAATDFAGEIDSLATFKTRLT